MATRLLPILLAIGFISAAHAESLDIWIGNLAAGDDHGLYHASFDAKTGKIGRAAKRLLIRLPGFLAMHPKLPVLYSTGKADDGTPSLFACQVGRGVPGAILKRLGRVPTGAGEAAHVSVDKTGRVLLAAFYGTGTVASYPLDEEGRIGPRASLIKHAGGSRVVAGRQDTPHPHWAGVSHDNRFVFVPDLGTDKIHHYRLDVETAELTPTGTTATPPGGGPRHFAFHPSGRWAYVVNELAMSLTVFQYDPTTGSLSELQTIATLSRAQRDAESFNSGSEVQVHPSGRFVYSGNRGHDSISVFAVDQSTGELALLEQEPIRGAWPRHFTLTPDGRWLLAAGRDSNTLAVFRVSPTEGRLQYARQTTSAPAPICVLAVAARLSDPSPQD